MKLKEIQRTSTFAWSPFSSLPLIATGTVAGALDASFSNDSQLEIWDPDFINKSDFDLGSEEKPGPKGFVTTSSRYVKRKLQAHERAACSRVLWRIQSRRLRWSNDGVEQALLRGLGTLMMQNRQLGLVKRSGRALTLVISDSTVLPGATSAMLDQKE